MSNKDDQYWNQIDDYLDGELSATTHETFRQRLSDDPELAKDTLFQQEMRQGIAYGSQGDLRTRLQTIHQETVEIDTGAKIVPIGRTLWLRWAVAAGMILGALGILFWVQNQGVNGPSLYAANYEAYSVDTTTRSPGEDAPSTIALDAYREGRYATAADQLERILDEDPDNAPLQLALAVSYWETGNKAAADKALNGLYTHPLLSEQAHWYTALFALADDRRTDALEALTRIDQDSGKLGRRAAELRRRLQD